MRTRFLAKLTNQEVEDYLERNDVIIVPVGTVEMHGGLPLDCETVLAEAFALKMAEAADGLVLDHLPYFYAGATAMGRGTVQVSVRLGIDYLHGIARSLLRQGFRRQIYVSFHGPAEYTCSAMVRDFFDDTKVQALYVDLARLTMKDVASELQGMLAGDRQEAMDKMNDIFFGGYEVLGQIEDIPLTTAPEGGVASRPATPGAQYSGAITPNVSGVVGFYFERKEDHAPTPVLRTPEERKARGLRGAALINDIVARMDVPAIVLQMQKWQAFQDEVVIPQYRAWLP